MLLEIACFNVDSCIIAQEAGADRIEFCSDYASGGITPALTEIIKVRELLQIPLHVLIRPRPGNFIYSSEEIKQMQSDIAFCHANGVNGVVFGALNKHNKIDIELNKQLLEHTGTMSSTSHRAIDLSPDLNNSVEALISLGFRRVLTSGGCETAIEGREAIGSLQKKYGSEITIVPGGGIRSSSIGQILKSTACTEFHSAAMKPLHNLPDSIEIEKMKDVLRQRVLN